MGRRGSSSSGAAATPLIVGAGGSVEADGGGSAPGAAGGGRAAASIRLVSEWYFLLFSDGVQARGGSLGPSPSSPVPSSKGGRRRQSQG